MTFTPSGDDNGGSGIDTCQAAVVYNGPDTNSGSVTRTCTDKAGNTGSDTASFKYDATAPTVSVTPDRPADSGGYYNPR